MLRLIVQLSILVLFVLSRDTPTKVHLMMLYFDLRHKRYFNMFCL